jgi:lipopolysaccharide export system protein LptA
MSGRCGSTRGLNLLMNLLDRLWAAGKHAAGRGAVQLFPGVRMVLAIGLLLFAGRARGQRVVEGKGFKFAEYFDPPHETQMKWLLEGAKAQPQPGGRILIGGAKLQTFRENEMAVEAPECVYDQGQRSISSPGSLHLRTADGKFYLEGEGFLWQQTNSSLFVSNRVHTIVQPDLLRPQSANAVTNPGSPGAAGIEIFSDQFDYATNSGLGIYRGNVRLTDTNLTLAGGILTFVLPMSGLLKPSGLQTLTVETNVVVDYEKVHASGERASYSPDTDLIRLTGKPARWHAEQREGRGEDLILDRRNGIFRSRGHAWLKMPGQSTGASGFLPRPHSPATNSLAATNQFVEILSDNYEVRTNSAVFREEVRVSERRGDQEQGKMSCETLTAAFSGTNELQQLVAETNVILEQDTNRFAAGRAVYSGTNGMLELTESPTWRSGLREGKGDLIRVDVKRDEMLVRSNAFMRLPASELGRSAGLGPGAPAQAGPKAGARQFAEILCREYTVGPEGALFRGAVRLDHPQIQWASERITALVPPGGGRINRTVAEQAVVFDLTDDKGQQVHGTGEKAVYTYGRSATVTNEVMELTGSPATLTTTNFTGQNSVFILDLANHRLGAPGKSKYVMRGLASDGGTNTIRMPGELFTK